MNKKYDGAADAAKKFITLPEDQTEAEPVKRRPGRPRKTEAAADQKPAEATKTAKAKKPATKRSKPVTDAHTKPQRKSDAKAAFSVWLDKTTADEMKLYSEISGEKMTDVVAAALKDYLASHKLTAKQKAEDKKRLQERINDIS